MPDFTMQDAAQIVSELDVLHEQLRGALDRKDRDAFQAFFSPKLSYRQQNGTVIDRDRLMRDIAVQFRYYCRTQSSFDRESMLVEANHATETLNQSAYVTISGLLFVHRVWLITRRGRYTWRKEDGHWRIAAVEVLGERVKPIAIRFGLRPPKFDSIASSS
jgi:Domain of unknown function (DUF4440)